METNSRVAIASIIKTIMEDSSSDSSDDDLHLVLMNILARHQPKKRKLKPRIKNYIDIVKLYSDIDFKSHFRLTRSTFQYILDYIGGDLVKVHSGNDQLAPNVQVLIALWRMANTETYRSIADRFNVGKATAYRSVNRVMDALLKNITMFIHWPSSYQIESIKRGFEQSSCFPNTMGAIDGTEIEIKCPGNVNKADYINRKSYASIKLQAVCDHRCLFTSIFVGFPGSTHDQRVFRVSPLDSYLNDEDKFPGDTHLIGDAAYALHPKLMVPFKDNGHLTARQQNFNFCLSSARMPIERSFELLKGRWRGILNCVPMNNTQYIPKFIATCCILHNICILNEDELTETIAQQNNINESQTGLRTIVNGSSYHQEAVIKRNLIATQLPLRDI